MTQPQLSVGRKVHVYAAGTWRDGRITRIGRTRASVEYVRNAAGQLGERAFRLPDIHPATGVRLVHVDRLGNGARVILADADRTVDGVYRHDRRQRRIHFTDDTNIVVAAGGMLRVRKTKPGARRSAAAHPDDTDRPERTDDAVLPLLGLPPG